MSDTNQCWSADRRIGSPHALPVSHYPYGFDTIEHLGLIYLATAIFVVGALLALRGLREARS